MRRPRRGRSAESGRWSESSANDREACVCAGGGRFSERRTSELCVRVSTENTCRRGTSDASGQHVADAKREVATPFFFFFIWGLCVSAVGGLVR